VELGAELGKMQRLLARVAKGRMQMARAYVVDQPDIHLVGPKLAFRSGSLRPQSREDSSSAISLSPTTSTPPLTGYLSSPG